MSYEPADADLPTENVWSSEKYLRSVPELFEAARDALGWDVHLLHDVHHRLTPIEAGRLGKDLEPYRLFWLEDAVPAENQANFRLIRQHTTTPLAVGEVFNIDLGLQAADRRTADRLYPRHRGPCRRHHPSAPHRRLGRSLQCAHRLPRRHRPVAGLHGGGAAFRRLDSQFRHPGIDAPHARRPTRSSRTPTAIATACCIPAKRRAWAWRSTRSWPRNIPTSAPILPVNRLEDGTHVQLVRTPARDDR